MPDSLIWNGHFFIFAVGTVFLFAIGTFFVFENGTFRIPKLYISFLIIRRLRDKVTWEMSTFEMSGWEGKNKQRKL